MKIAIAGMEDVGDAQPIFRSYPIHICQHLRQSRTGNDCVLDHRVRCDPPNCAKRTLARRPKLFALDRKSTRLNSSHEWISYAVFCLKKKRTTPPHTD